MIPYGEIYDHLCATYPADTVHAFFNKHERDVLERQGDKVAAIKQAALLRAQGLKDDAIRMRIRAKQDGKNPDRAKAVIKADEAFEGALTLLAHVLVAAGESDLLRAGLPSQEATDAYLESWDTKRHVRAIGRAFKA